MAATAAVETAAAAGALDKETRDRLIAVLEAFDASERLGLAQVSTKEMKAPKDNRGVVRGLVLSCEQKTGFDAKPYYWVVFRVVDAAPGMPGGHMIKNGYNKEVARVSADRQSMFFTYNRMDDKVNGNKNEWIMRNVAVVDEIGYEIDRATGKPADPPIRKTGETVSNGDVIGIRMEGKHEFMVAFTLADFQISMTEYVTDPKKATLKAGQLPVHSISRVVKASTVVRRSNRKEIVRFLRSNPSLAGPLRSVAHILHASGYVHVHVLNVADAPKDLSRDTYFLPLFPSVADYVDFFGNGPGMLFVAEEDRSVDPNDPSKVQNAHEWHKFDSPTEQHAMWRMKAAMRPYSSPAELLGTGTGQFPVPMFPRFTLSVPIYDNCLPFKITDLAVWARMAPHMFKNFSMFIPAQVQLYATAESPANAEGTDRFDAQHLFMSTKMPIHEIPEEALNKVGLEVSPAGAAHLIQTGRLVHGANFSLRDVRDKNAPGERTYFNLNECTPALALHLTSRSQRAQFRFVAILGKTLTADLRKDLAAVRKYALEHPNAVAGEVLLSDKWNSNIGDYMRATYGAAALAAAEAAAAAGTPDAPGVPMIPEFPADHIIVTEKMRTSSIIAPAEMFILYAIDLGKLRQLAEEAEAQDSPFAEIFKNVASSSSSSATPLLGGGGGGGGGAPQLQITNGDDDNAKFEKAAIEAAAKAEQDALAANTLAAQEAAEAAAAHAAAQESKKRATPATGFNPFTPEEPTVEEPEAFIDHQQRKRHQRSSQK